MDELKQRGTAEISNGKVVQVTQALNETENSVEFLIFGEIKKQGIIPLAEACTKCDHSYFATVDECQARQRKDAIDRGFSKLVCPNQLF